MNPNLSLYEIFYAAARHGNISRAASELFISQPAVSKSIRKLEESLQTTLFIRNSRGVTLTADGELLYAQVQEAFRSLDLAEQTLYRRHTTGYSTLKIGVSTTLCKYILLPYLQTFIQKHPRIHVTIQCQSSGQTLSLLEDRQIDLGLIGHPQKNLSCYYHPLQKIQDTFVCTDSYLAHLPSGNRQAILASAATFLLPDSRNITRHYMDTALKSNGITLSHILEVSTMDLLIEFSRIGLGIACVIREFVKDDLASGLLTELPILPELSPREIGFICRKGEQNLEPVRQFLDMLPTLSP